MSGLTWWPVGRRAPVLRAVNLRVAPGERVLLAGPSGAGKSTLLGALAGVLGADGADGELSGEVRVAGGDPRCRPGRAGLLLQEPLDAVVAATAGRDTAFGPENLALPRAEIHRRVRQALADAGFPYPEGRSTSALSGGELQRLALAGTLALRPGLLLLDEPTSMLHPDAAAKVRSAVLGLGRRHAVVVVDHRLASWLDVVDRLVVLGSTGGLVADGPPQAVLARHGPDLAAAGLWLPGVAPPAPLAIDPELLRPLGPHVPVGQVCLLARGLVVERRRRGLRPSPPVRALDGVDVQVPAGRITVVTGDSGAGKSTLVAALAGLLQPAAGEVLAHPALAAARGRAPARWTSQELAARLGWVPQHPELGFVAHSVAEEALATGSALGRAAAAGRAAGLLEIFGLSPCADLDPHLLSGGEQRRLVLAAAVAHGPAALLLDEPTVGQDRGTWAVVAGVLTAAARAGAAVVAASHDPALVAAGDDVVPLAPPGHRPAEPVRR